MKHVFINQRLNVHLHILSQWLSYMFSLMMSNYPLRNYLLLQGGLDVRPSQETSSVSDTSCTERSGLGSCGFLLGAQRVFHLLVIVSRAKELHFLTLYIYIYMLR